MQETLVVLESDVEPPTVRIALSRSMPQYAAVCRSMQCVSVIKSRSFQMIGGQEKNARRGMVAYEWQGNMRAQSFSSALLHFCRHCPGKTVAAGLSLWTEKDEKDEKLKLEKLDTGPLHLPIAHCFSK